ncbi:hypothetical protein ACWGTO_30880 [Mesorhizobium sp. PL10]
MDNVVPATMPDLIKLRRVIVMFKVPFFVSAACIYSCCLNPPDGNHQG